MIPDILSHTLTPQTEKPCSSKVGKRGAIRRSARIPTVKLRPIEALFSAADAQGIPFSTLMRLAGVCQKSHWSWRFEYAPNAAHLEAALNVVGLTLAVAPLKRGRAA